MIRSTWVFGSFTRDDLTRFADYTIEDTLEQQANALCWLLDMIAHAQTPIPETLPDVAASAATRLGSLAHELIRRRAIDAQGRP